LNLALFIALKIAKAKKKSFSRFIMRISILATTVSVATMIVALSFINGFQDIIADKIFGFWGHIRVMHYEPVRATMAEELPILGTDSLKKLIDENPNIERASRYATRSAILNASGTIEGILLKGVDSTYPFEKLDRFLIKGKWPTEKDDSTRGLVVISEYTARQLNVDVGKPLLIYFIQNDGTLPRIRKLIISGIYRTGIDVYDKVYALGNIEMIQKMNGWKKEEIGGYEIDLKNPEKMDEIAGQIFTILPAGWNAQTLRELSPEIFDWLGLQNTNKYILLTLMTIVAIINLITCLIILLIERTPMIALLKSLGARDHLIQKVFIIYGSWISILGILLGSILGVVICLLQKYTAFIRLNEEVYYVNAAPVSLELSQVFLIAGATFLVSTLMLLIPSVISRKVNPARALLFK
jgi:lipoprotein-releasing system permease protein